MFCNKYKKEIELYKEEIKNYKEIHLNEMNKYRQLHTDEIVRYNKLLIESKELLTKYKEQNEELERLLHESEYKNNKVKLIFVEKIENIINELISVDNILKAA